MLADNPTLRAALHHKTDAAERFGASCKEVHRLAQIYAQTVASAAAAWQDLASALQRAVPEMRMGEEGRQVTESLTALSESVDSSVAVPFRAHYDKHVKPLREQRKRYDKVRHAHAETMARSLSLKKKADPAALEAADRGQESAEDLVQRHWDALSAAMER